MSDFQNAFTIYSWEWSNFLTFWKQLVGEDLLSQHLEGFSITFQWLKSDFLNLH